MYHDQNAYGMYVLQLSPEFQLSILEKLNNLRIVFNLFCKKIAKQKNNVLKL